MDVSDDRISRLEARIEELEGRLRATLVDHDESSAVSAAVSGVEGPTTGDRQVPDRRAMLRTLGLAGAAVAAGTASAVASAAPAAAADGSALLIGEDNVQNLTDSTMLRYTAATAPSAGNVVTVADVSTGLGSFFPASLAGYAFGRVANGVYGYSNVTGGRGVAGVAEESGATSVGVYGKASGAGANAIVGDATAPTGQGTGVLGQTASTKGRGVVGDATATSGQTIGVLGQTASGAGQGVAGHATATTGSTLGVSGIVESPDGIGVYGHAPSTGGPYSIGVQGLAQGMDATGVYGANTHPSGTGPGVRGLSPQIGVWGQGYGAGAAVGVLANSSDPASFAVSADAGAGTGVLAQGELAGVRAQSARTQLRFTGAPVAPLGAGLARSAGEMVFDVNNDLWVCVASGTPGTWRRVSGPSTAGAFVPLPAPVRVYDSRPGFNPATGPKTKLTPSTPRTVDCTLNSSGVPIGASGVLVNLVATGVSVAGDMAIYKDGIPYPGTSNVNFAGGQTVAVTTFSTLSTSAKVAVRSNVGPDVVLDVLGYYQ